MRFSRSLRKIGCASGKKMQTSFSFCRSAFTIFVPMKSAIELFSALGRRLADFGGDVPTQEVAERACRANGWFTPADVRRAVAAIADGMLRRDRLETWLAPVPVAVPRRVLVVMAGNIPLVGFFDLLCVLAAGHRCLVKPSAKDRVLTEYVVGMLRELDPEVPVGFCDGSSPVDAVIATGSDNANRYFRTQYAGIPALLRGSRLGLFGAWVPQRVAAFRSGGVRPAAADACGERKIPEQLPPAKSPADDDGPSFPGSRERRRRRRAGFSRRAEPHRLLALQNARRSRSVARAARRRTAMRRFGVRFPRPPHGIRPRPVPGADRLSRRPGCNCVSRGAELTKSIIFV